MRLLWEDRAWKVHSVKLTLDILKLLKNINDI